jgi:hypothetical protein
VWQLIDPDREDDKWDEAPDPEIVTLNIAAAEA